MVISEYNCGRLGLAAGANIRLMESVVNPSPSNRFRVLTGLAQRYTAVAAVAAASALSSPALASKITFETAAFGAFTGPVTEEGFMYSRLSGALFIDVFGNPGQDAEGNAAAGGGVLKIVSANGGDFNFNALDFSAFDFSGTG